MFMQHRPGHSASIAHRTWLASATIGALAVSLLVARPAHAADSGLKTPREGLKNLADVRSDVRQALTAFESGNTQVAEWLFNEVAMEARMASKGVPAGNDALVNAARAVAQAARVAMTDAQARNVLNLLSAQLAADGVELVCRSVAGADCTGLGADVDANLAKVISSLPEDPEVLIPLDCNDYEVTLDGEGAACEYLNQAETIDGVTATTPEIPSYFGGDCQGFRISDVFKASSYRVGAVIQGQCSWAWSLYASIQRKVCGWAGCNYSATIAEKRMSNSTHGSRYVVVGIYGPCKSGTHRYRSILNQRLYAPWGTYMSYHVQNPGTQITCSQAEATVDLSPFDPSISL